MLGLSIIIPNFNHAKYLPECLDSILNQSYVPDEIIVIDDCSTDDSVYIIKKYQKNYPQIILLENSSNRGVHFSSNRGIAAARYSHGTFLAADDFRLPDFFFDAMQLFKANPELGLVCGNSCYFYDIHPYRFESYHFLQLPKPSVLSVDQTIQILKKTNFRIESCSSVYNLNLFKKYGCYNKELKSLCDHYYNYQIALRHSIGYVPKVHAAVRLLPNSYGAIINDNKQNKLAAYEAFIKSIDKEDSLFKKAVRKSRCLATCGFFLILYLLKNPRYWIYLPSICLKKFPHLLVRIWCKIKKVNPPIFPVPRTSNQSLSDLGISKFRHHDI